LRRKNFFLLELLEILEGILGKKIKRLFREPKPGDVKHSQADIPRTKELLGYQPKIRFQEGFRKTVECFKDKLSK